MVEEKESNEPHEEDLAGPSPSDASPPREVTVVEEDVRDWVWEAGIEDEVEDGGGSVLFSADITITSCPGSIESGSIAGDPTLSCVG